ncbi:MAG: (deoxy)nucleoside triphosphate pyrophosphohydrolase [Lachnospiraceae bacterium]|nr:(deoxy)nucleoside triphosphate pyrophosphohydrolase [Lachnospiraceae bacterium]MBQ4275648.1 (deoxy)nucleoside triphosphate pyrophosphohydrolase [Lachnospiraceae bacterium]
MALLKLVGDTTKYVEVSEAELEKNGIKEGKKVIIANGKVLKYVRVVAAVIRSKNENGEPIIFATQRGYGEYKDGWEFPGGKIEEGETPEDALVREIKEELDTEIVVEDLIDTIEYDYPTFHLSMDCFFCKLLSGNLVLKEHEAAKWLTKEQLDSVDWLPADITLINKLF